METNKYNINAIENGRSVIYEYTCEERIAKELEELDSMTEKEACNFYNTDSKQEAATAIIEYWKYIA